MRNVRLNCLVHAEANYDRKITLNYFTLIISNNILNSLFDVILHFLT